MNDGNSQSGDKYLDEVSRNLGWVTSGEQERLRKKRVAIAGLGGVGGDHFLTLIRLGIERFNLSDFDSFETVNFNRQTGATRSSVGRPKLDVMIKLALDINPNLDIRRFPNGVTTENTQAFLTDVDIYIDGLDFFAVNARRAVFSACNRMKIPAITAAPLGMGVAWLNFLPGRMSFEEYFRMEGHSESEQLVRFLVGLAPSALHSSYLVDPSTIDLKNHKGPSTRMACQMCAGVAGTEALKILLGRGEIQSAPVSLHFDVYLNRFKRSWLPWGNANPLQRIRLSIGRKKLLNALVESKGSNRNSVPDAA